MRDLIFAERDQGRTIFFSTHILSDVEAMCDRVAILREGQVVVSGALRQLLRGDVLGTEITLAGASEALLAARRETGLTVSRRPDVVVVSCEGESRVGEVLQQALARRRAGGGGLASAGDAGGPLHATSPLSLRKGLRALSPDEQARWGPPTPDGHPRPFSGRAASGSGVGPLGQPSVPR